MKPSARSENVSALPGCLGEVRLADEVRTAIVANDIPPVAGSKKGQKSKSSLRVVPITTSGAF